MSFDVQAALAEILSDPPRDTPAPVSRMSQGATPENQKSFPPAELAQSQPAGDPHGHSVTGAPLKWTDRVVSLDEWRKLSDWDRHGLDGRVWNGLT